MYTIWNEKILAAARQRRALGGLRAEELFRTKPFTPEPRTAFLYCVCNEAK